MRQDAPCGWSVVRCSGLNSISSLTYQVTSARTRSVAHPPAQVSSSQMRSSLPAAAALSPAHRRSLLWRGGRRPRRPILLLRSSVPSLPNEVSFLASPVVVPRFLPLRFTSVPRSGAAFPITSIISIICYRTTHSTPLRSSNPSLSSISSSPSPSGTGGRRPRKKV